MQEQRKEILKSVEARSVGADAMLDPEWQQAVSPLGLAPLVGSTLGNGVVIPPATLAMAATLTKRASFASEAAPLATPAQPGESASLFLKELPRSATEDTICQLFSRYGTVTGINITPKVDNGAMLEGYITLDSRESAQRAKDALQDRDVDGVPLWIEWAKPSPTRSDAVPFLADGVRRVVVQPPDDARKRRIIDRLAKYVAQEGHPFEQVIMERESPDGDFAFLFEHDSPDNMYYRWRTFAFCQGDNFQSWRTETFRICDGGAWWRPPPCYVPKEAKKRSTNFSSGPPAAVAEAAQPKASAICVGGAAAASSGAAAPKASALIPRALPAHWSPQEIEEERERNRLEEKATQERQRRNTDRKGIAGGKRLMDADWDGLEKLLRNVTIERCAILEAMVFCMDKCDTAIDITECITQSLTIVETDVALKMARLMLVSDILHNTTSSKPAAWAYRREFEKSLPDIIEHFHVSLSRLESRIGADKAREQVMRILNVWEEWGLFAPQYVRGLEAVLAVGVKPLRALAVRGDSSREPGWLEPKLADWRRQHFSQLEKMCRTRGLRCSTSHVEATKELSLEDARREWLIDRLACYELHSHEKEAAKAAADKASATMKARGKRKEDEKRRKRREEDPHRKRREDEDIDGEEIGSGIDGLPLEEGDFEGEPMDIDVHVELLHVAELEALVFPTNSTGLIGTSRYPDSPGGAVGSDGEVIAGMTESAIGTRIVVVDATAGAAADQPPVVAAPPQAEVQTPPAGAGGDSLDIERPEDPAAFDPHARAQEAHGTDAGGAAAEGKSRVDRGALRRIELEVMELRASLENQGLFRDAIEDICGEKRQRLIEEHEASLASPPFGREAGGGGADSDDDSDSPPAGHSTSRGRDSERERAALAALKANADRDKDREKGRARERSREREKERTKEKERDRERERADRGRKDKDKDKEREREREKDAPRGRDVEKASKRPPAQRLSRSWSRDRAKKTRK